MTYEERLCGAYELVIRKRADDIISKLVIKVIRTLQSYKRDTGMMQSEEDGFLANLWDEVCTQVQGEQSIFWSYYEDLIFDTVSKLLEKFCSMCDLQMLWLQSEEFEEWSECEYKDEDDLDPFFDPLGFPDGFSKDGAIDYVCKAVLDVAADYRNSRIETYLCREQ